MARPSPLPGTDSSRRAPRATTASRRPDSMPGPSSSMTIRSIGPCPLSNAQACTRPTRRAHLKALSSTLPRISCRSWASPAKPSSGAIGPDSTLRPRSTCTRSITRSKPSMTGVKATFAPGRPCAAAARERARCQSTWRRAMATCSCTSGASSTADCVLRCIAAAACSFAGSGVLIAWARLPASVRARDHLGIAPTPSGEDLTARLNPIRCNMHTSYVGEPRQFIRLIAIAAMSAPLQNPRPAIRPLMLIRACAPE